jgi:hypothetical protein
MFLKIEAKDLHQENSYDHTFLVVNVNLFGSFHFYDKFNAFEIVGLNEGLGCKFFFKDLQTYEKYKAKILTIIETKE